MSRAINSFFENPVAYTDEACNEDAANEPEADHDCSDNDTDANAPSDEQEGEPAPAATGSKRACTVAAFDRAISRGALDDEIDPMLATYFPSFARALQSPKELEVATATCLEYAEYAVNKLGVGAEGRPGVASELVPYMQQDRHTLGQKIVDAIPPAVRLLLAQGRWTTSDWQALAIPYSDLSATARLHGCYLLLERNVAYVGSTRNLWIRIRKHFWSFRQRLRGEETRDNRHSLYKNWPGLKTLPSVIFLAIDRGAVTGDHQFIDIVETVLIAMIWTMSDDCMISFDRTLAARMRHPGLSSIFCGMNMILPTTLPRHEKSTHNLSDSDMKLCGSCPRAFPTWNGLDDHYRVAHPSITRPYRCCYCSADFRTHYDQNRHEYSCKAIIASKESGEWKYECEDCDIHTNHAMTWDDHLSTALHVRVMHLDSPFPLWCVLCAWGTADADDWEAHQTDERHVRYATGKYRYSCHPCGFHSIKPRQLRIHKTKRTHELMMKALARRNLSINLCAEEESAE